jgi:hypothetical protein
MKIHKVRYSSKAGVTIDYEAENQSKPGTTDHITLCSQEPAREEFEKALEALKPHLLEMLELPEGYGSGLTVSGATFTHKNEAVKVVIVGKKVLSGTNSPFNIITPAKPMIVKEESASDDLVTDECREALNNLIAEAKLYAKGERLQQTLNLEGDGE